MKKLEFVVELRDKMSRALENIKRLMAEASDGARGLSTEASRTGDASAAIGRLENALDNVSQAGDEASEAVSALGDTSEGASAKAGSLLDRLRGMEAVQLNNLAELAGRIGDMMASATESGMTFDQAMADLSSITGIVGDDLANLERNARRVGAESGLGADTAARAYSLLASQIDVATIGIEGLNTLQQNSVTLAQASGMTLDEAANALAGTINQFGLGADSAARVINVLAAGSKYGAAEIGELSQSFKVVGAAASAMGMNVEQTAGALEVLSKANLKGSEAGTALRNIILKLNTELGVDLGETSLGTALEALKPKLSDTAYLAKLFGAENIAAAQFLIQNAEAVDLMTGKVTDTSVALEQAAIRTDTTANRMQVLRARVEDLKIGLAGMLGPMGPYVALLAENAQALSLTSVMMQKSVSGLGTLAKAASTARKAFLALSVAGKAMTAALGIGLLATAVAAIAALKSESDEAARSQQALADTAARMNAEVMREQTELDTLFEPLRAAKEGTDEWRKARNAVVDRYGEYLGNLGIEIERVGDVEEAYVGLKTSIEDAARARALEAVTAEQSDELVRRQAESLKNLRTLVDEAVSGGGMTAADGERLWEGLKEAVRTGRPLAEDLKDIVVSQAKAMRADNGQGEVAEIKVNRFGADVDRQVRLATRALEDYQQAVRQANELFAPESPVVEQPKPVLPDYDPSVETKATIEADEQSIAALQKRLDELQKQMDAAPMEQAMTFLPDIVGLEAQIKAIRARLDREKFVVRFGIEKLNPAELKPTDLAKVMNLDGVTEMTKKAGEALGDLGKQKRKADTSMKDTTPAEAAQQGLGAVGSTLQSLSGMLGEGAAQWMTYAANVVGAVAAAIPAIAAVTAAKKVEANANMEAAATGAASSVASIPFVGPLMAVAAVASVLAALASIPKFAAGGIAYGPTLGLFGEYAGAATNPEVVAPLDRLRALLDLDGPGREAGRVEFRIKGRALEGVLSREQNRRRRLR